MLKSITYDLNTAQLVYVKGERVKFTEHYGLNKKQSEIDFIDIYSDSDVMLFIDPHSISIYETPILVTAHNSLCDFFETLTKRITNNEEKEALTLLSFLGEPNEFHLGLSSTSQGRGIGDVQSQILFNEFSRSKALAGGYVDNLAKCELFIEGIGPDKISDIAANVVRKALIIYTQQQCHNYGIPMENVSSGFFWDEEHHDWFEDYVDLPVQNDSRLILTPKRIARRSTLYDPRQYYRGYILNFLQNRFESQQSLGMALQKGKKPRR